MLFYLESFFFVISKDVGTMSTLSISTRGKVASFQFDITKISCSLPISSKNSLKRLLLSALFGVKVNYFFYFGFKILQKQPVSEQCNTCCVPLQTGEFQSLEKKVYYVTHNCGLPNFHLKIYFNC